MPQTDMVKRDKPEESDAKADQLQTPERSTAYLVSFHRHMDY